MSENDKQTNGTNNDEIDLKELFNAIGNFFKSIFISIMMFFVHFKNATVKNSKLIILFGFLGGFAGIALNYASEDYYKSSLVLRSTHLTGRLMESSIEKLNQLSEEEDHAQLAIVLKISPELADQIKAFSYEPFVSEDEVVSLEVFKEQLRAEIEDDETIEIFIDKLKSENRNTYRIFIEVFDNNIIDQIQAPLLSYFSTNTYVKKRLEITKRNLELEKQNITEELVRLDSLKVLIFKNFDMLSNKGRAGSNNVILSDENMANPIDVINQSRAKYNDILRINSRLFLGADFELIDGFVAYSTPDSPSLIKFGFFSGLTGLGIAYIIIVLLSFNTYLNRIEKDQRKKELS
ncbi:MAG: hypothetical protein ACI9K1_000020 [Arcticibacterium sp.]|jgi:hypothetical protein